MLATSLFALGAGLNPHLQLGADSLPSVAIRLSMYVAAGLVTGAFAQTMRRVTAKLETVAERDHLTGLYNARAYEAALARRVGQQAPFALLLFDMDNLKAVNDTHGHQAGSDAIQKLGTMLSHLVRESDHVSRVGGDEFAVLCSPATKPGAQAFAERLSRSLAESGVPASFGWALFPSDGDEPISLYRTADERLYAEKARRRPAVLDRVG